MDAMKQETRRVGERAASANADADDETNGGMSMIESTAQLVSHLRELSRTATQTAKLVRPDYLNPSDASLPRRITSRSVHVLRGIGDAEHAFGPQLGAGAGIDATAAMNAARLDVETGLRTLREGTIVQDDVLRDGSTFIGRPAAERAAGLFDAAAARLALAADGLELQALDGAALTRALTS